MNVIDGEPDFDVGIIGGGPAGAAMGAYLAKAGVRCVVFERELFPRPHVGESLVPSSTRVFKELDFIRVMHEAGFPRKYGAAWTTTGSSLNATVDWHGLAPDTHAAAAGGDGAPEGLAPDTHAEIRFEERDQPGVEQNYTWHVDRGKFDLLLLQHAHRFGAEVYEGIKVARVDFPDGEHPTVRFQSGRREHAVRCKIVVDASGRHTVLGSQLKVKVRDPVFDQYAIHSWFQNFDRKRYSRSGDGALGDYIFIHFLPVSNTWIWQIPIDEAVTSVGVVTQKKNFAKGRADREQFFWDALATRPEICEPLRQAERIRPFKDEGDYSYAMRQICGDRWVLIGDAARFVDPIFSTGVSIALNSARFAHRDVLGALESGVFRREAFQSYETTIRRGTNNWYEFIQVYYRLNILFTYFINNHRYRLDVLKLLQGDVYDEEAPEVLRKMKDAVAAVENDPAHPWHKLLNDLTHQAFKPTF